MAAIKQTIQNWSILSYCLVFLCLLPNYSFAKDDNEIVNICVATEEWLPYFSWSDGRGGKLNQPIGITADSIDVIFKAINRSYTIKPILWSRLNNAKGNTHRNCDVIWDVSAGVANSRNFLLSIPIYQMPTTVIYNTNSLSPQRLQSMELADLFKKRQSICGIRGFDYRELNTLVNVTVSNTQQALDVLRHGRCSLFFMGTPVYEYGLKTGKYRIADNIAYQELSDDYVAYYFIAVTSRDAESQQMLRQINKIITNMQIDGTWENLFARYGIMSRIHRSRQESSGGPLRMPAPL